MYILATNIRLISNTIRIQFQKLLSFKTITFTFIYIFEKRVTYVSNTIRISNIEFYKNSNYFNYFKMIFICNTNKRITFVATQSIGKKIFHDFCCLICIITTRFD